MKVQLQTKLFVQKLTDVTNINHVRAMMLHTNDQQSVDSLVKMVKCQNVPRSWQSIWMYDHHKTLAIINTHQPLLHNHYHSLAID